MTIYNSGSLTSITILILDIKFAIQARVSKDLLSKSIVQWSRINAFGKPSKWGIESTS